MQAAWIESLGGVPAVSAVVAVVTAAVTCYRLRVRERMHTARLEAAQKLAEAGSTAVLGPHTAIVAPASSPLTSTSSCGRQTPQRQLRRLREHRPRNSLVEPRPLSCHHQFLDSCFRQRTSGGGLSRQPLSVSGVPTQNWSP